VVLARGMIRDELVEFISGKHARMDL
jgi:hypothetical protein